MAGTVIPSVYAIRLTDGGKVVDSQSIGVVPGKVARFSDEKTVVYASGMKSQGGTVHLHHSAFSTGVTGTLRDSVKHPGVLRLSVFYTRLAKMHSFVVDGHTLDQPVLQAHTFVDSVVFRNGQSITLSSVGKGQKVSLVVTKVS